MAKFCGVCGSRLDEQTGKCPNCDKTSTENNGSPESYFKPAPKDLGQSDSVSQSTVQNSDNPKIENSTIPAVAKNKKPRKFIIAFVITFVLVSLLTAGTLVVLELCDIVDIPFVNKILVSVGLEEKDEASPVKNDSDEKVQEDITEDIVTSPDTYKVTPPDAKNYFENNSKIIYEVKLSDSQSVSTEAETYSNLHGRGFSQYPITSEYTSSGTYYEATSISSSSHEAHPMYQTYYVTSSGDIWTIFEINGVVMANPVSYNLNSGLGVQTMLSESETVTSYDNTTQTFFETIPNSSELIVKQVAIINSETLENLTYGDIDEL